jgi:hypothetical protein
MQKDVRHPTVTITVDIENDVLTGLMKITCGEKGDLEQSWPRKLESCMKESSFIPT